MSARTQMCLGDTMAEVGYNYLRTLGTADAPYFLNLFRTLFNANYRDFIAAYPDVGSVFIGDVNTPEGLSRILFTLFLWKMGYLRGTTDAEGYYIDVVGLPGHTSGFYTGRILPATNPRVRRVTEGARPQETPEQIGRNAARTQKRLENSVVFARGLPARSEADFTTWFRNASTVATWQPTFRNLTSTTAEAALSASNVACEAASSTSLLADAFDFTPIELLPYDPPVVTPGTPATPPGPPATPIAPESSGFNVGMLVAGAAFGWLITRFFR